MDQNNNQRNIIQFKIKSIFTKINNSLKIKKIFMLDLFNLIKFNS
jgi:hypothetical protein